MEDIAILLAQCGEVGADDAERLGANRRYGNTRPRKSLGWQCPAERFLPASAFDFTTATLTRIVTAGDKKAALAPPVS